MSSEGSDKLAVVDGSTITEFKLGELIIDSTVQRSTLNERRAQEMALVFDWEAFGLPAVSVRQNGDVIKIDGMHRCRAAEIYLEDSGEDTFNHPVRCEAWYGLSHEEEAQIFLKRNATSKVGTVDRFKVRLTAKDATALAINEMIGRYGWSVSGTKAKSTLACIFVLEKWWDINPAALEKALKVATAAWGYNKDAGDGRVLDGLAMFMNFYDAAVDMPDLVDNLKKSGTAGDLIGQAVSYKSVTKVTTGRAVCQIVLVTYNTGRRSTKVPEFTGREK